MTVKSDLLHAKVVQSLEETGAIYEAMECDPSLADTAAFCEHYKFSETETANCIITASKTEPVKYACCVILSNSKLDVNKTVCKLLGVKKCSFATGEQTIALTNMQIGGVTPFGVPEMPIFIDSAVFQNERIVLGGGNRSSKLLINPAELKKLPSVQAVDNLGILK